ncbi:DNA-binding transcriptional regulator YhcF (GntR family) [Sedimentibacter acidaminivorans]|jgi:DNA-binding transcriptional regulator YhcF (GntR family)|uniref:DNA-binding transcriptional regulator YhcF (GntR family) n=1 Tax=Sedimentibacter acidaminivorans TaxID=913099 RepID=A0ABS4GGF3_9FIRM|nr:GntR family transcriptional regulator [Sedimentibacter acidaminivorans]MBP1926460.1 DNA-binding transcriptional regulator YhcF (GntR family) [Sedimentibacter acidaminivorans]
MEFNNNMPIYLQVIHKLKQDIVTGKLKLGEKMPSSRDYSNELGLNFNTIARVYKEMEMEDIVFTKRGLGTFITESSEKVENIRLEMAKELIENFINGMLQIGFTQEDMISFIKKSNKK